MSAPSATASKRVTLRNLTTLPTTFESQHLDRLSPVRTHQGAPVSIRSTLTRGSAFAAAGLAAVLTLSACGSSDPLASSATSATSAAAESASGSAAAGPPIVIGSANFPESALLANIYAAALAAEGIEATTNLNIGSREVYLQALDDGSINLVPEYTGVLLQYFDPAATAVSADDVYAALVAATPEGLEVLAKSPAEDKDAVVVTRATAEANNLTSIADLAPVASTFILGGPSEWETRPTGIPGLLSVYGLTFKEFKALDAGGPLTLNALIGDQIQAGNLFTTDPAIPANDLVVLEDPENLFAAQNIVPLISSASNTPEVTAVLDEVSAALTTEILTDLLSQVTVDKLDSVQVAEEWVAANLGG
jgi:osmoprotectant transport system substrate-binding protein